MLPVVLTIAGSDPSGGAGIQADQRAIEKAGASARSVVTAITAQTREGVRSWEAVSLSTLEAQLDAALDDGAVLAIKSGMIPSPGAARVVGAALRRHGVRRYVCDPVLASSAGVALAAPGTTDEMREALFSIATVLTPNAREAEVLSGRTIATIEDASAAGHVLLGSGARAVLIKGGHLGTNPVVDVLVTPADVLTLRRARVSVARTHGTGCRHSAYLAAMLAHGMELPGACSRAQELLAEELAIELGADR